MILLIVIFFICMGSLLFLGYCKKCNDKPDYILMCPKCNSKYEYVKSIYCLTTTSGDLMAPRNLLCRCTGYPDIETVKVNNKSSTEKFFQLFWGPLYYIVVIINTIKK